jgi:hypothetical protein
MAAPPPPEPADRPAPSVRKFIANFPLFCNRSLYIYIALAARAQGAPMEDANAGQQQYDDWQLSEAEWAAIARNPLSVRMHVCMIY